jgi:hypothetical protein
VPGSEITTGDKRGKLVLREGFATCSRLRAADKEAHIQIDNNKTAAQPKQMLVFLDGFCEQQLSL